MGRLQKRGVSLCLYVDDIALHVAEAESVVASSLAAAADQLITA